MQWNTLQIKTTIEENLALYHIQPEQILVGEREGDYDSEHIIINFSNNESLHVFGFSTKHVSRSTENIEVEHAVVSDRKWYDGGLNSDFLPLCISYGIICSAMRKLGFSVVPSMNNYF